MPTIEELLGDVTTENSTSENRDELNKLAAEIGLVGETGIRQANLLLRRLRCYMICILRAILAMLTF